jgi:hypothetical protein
MDEVPQQQLLRLAPAEAVEELLARANRWGWKIGHGVRS